MYFLVIFCSCLLLAAAEPQVNPKISSQLRDFHDAVSDARDELSTLRAALHAADEDELLRQRRRNIDELLANFEKDAQMADEMAAHNDWSHMIDEDRLDQMCGTHKDSCGVKKADKHGDVCKKNPCDGMGMTNVKKKRKDDNNSNRPKVAVVANDRESGNAGDKLSYDNWLSGGDNDNVNNNNNNNYQNIDTQYNEAGDFEDDPLEDVSYDDANYAGLVNDQVNTAKNDLSHEANYKLSKIEQDAAEKRKSQTTPFTKRSIDFNPMNEIKLKTSRRMMRKGYGPSLPSYSLGDTKRDMMIDDMVKKMERKYNKPRKSYAYEKYKTLGELTNAKDQKLRGQGFNGYGGSVGSGGYGSSDFGLTDIDHGSDLNSPVKRFITPKMSSEYDERNRDKRFADGVDAVSNIVPAVEDKKPELSIESQQVPVAVSTSKLVKKETNIAESKQRVKRIDVPFVQQNQKTGTPSMLKLEGDFGFVANEQRSKRAIGSNVRTTTKGSTEAENKAKKAAEENGVRKKRYVSPEDEIYEEYKDFDSIELNEDAMDGRLSRAVHKVPEVPPTAAKKRHKRSLDDLNASTKTDAGSQNDNSASIDSHTKPLTRSTQDYGNRKFPSLWYEQDIIQDVDTPKKKSKTPLYDYSKLMHEGGNEGKRDGFDVSFDLQSKGFRTANKAGGDYNYAAMARDNFKNGRDNDNDNGNRQNNPKNDATGHNQGRGPISMVLIESPQQSDNDNDESRSNREDSEKNGENNSSIDDESKVNEDEIAKEESNSGDENDARTKKADKISKTDENLVLALRDEILNCTNVENLQKILKRIRSNSTNSNSGVLPTPIGTVSVLPNADVNATDKKDDNVKLNITINASVSGNKKAKNFCGNGTINVRPGLLEDRERRRVRGISYRRHDGRPPMAERQRIRGAHRMRASSQRADCKAPGRAPASDSDNSELDNMVTGKLSQELVESIMGLVHSNPQLKPLMASFKRQRLPSRKHIKNLYALRNKGNEQQVQKTEVMLNKAMASISDIIEQQVRSRTCIPLRPDLLEFYNLILKSYNDQEPNRQRRASPVTWVIDFTKDVRAIDPNTIDKTSRIVKELLRKFDELPMEDRAQVIALRDELLLDLMYLRKVKENQAMLLERHKRMIIDSEKLNLSADENEDVRKLEANFTPEYMKLVKASEIYREINNGKTPSDVI